jgi:hypothetical protein
MNVNDERLQDIEANADNLDGESTTIWEYEADLDGDIHALCASKGIVPPWENDRRGPQASRKAWKAWEAAVERNPDLRDLLAEQSHMRCVFDDALQERFAQSEKAALAALAQLTGEETEVMRLRFCGNERWNASLTQKAVYLRGTSDLGIHATRTIAEISQQLGITPRRVCEALHRALRKLNASAAA